VHAGAAAARSRRAQGTKAFWCNLREPATPSAAVVASHSTTRLQHASHTHTHTGTTGPTHTHTHPHFGVISTARRVTSLGVDQCQFPDQCQSENGFLDLLNTFFGSKSWFSVDRFQPLISLGFVWKARLSRNVCERCRNIPREMICARCAAFQSAKSCIDGFWMARRIKSYKASSEPIFEQNFGILK
jgi:hypothetical protein